MKSNSLDLTEKFPASSVDAWQELVTKAFLKSGNKESSGADANNADAIADAIKSLTTTTLDGIDIRPIYARKDLHRDTDLSEARRQPAHVSTDNNDTTADQQPTWDICQKVRELTVIDGNRVLLEELLQGATSVHVAVTGTTDSTFTGEIEASRIPVENFADLQALTEGLYLNMIRLSCEPAVPDAPTAKLWQWWKRLYTDNSFNVKTAKLNFNGNLFSSAAISLSEAQWQIAANNIIDAVKESADFDCRLSHCAVDTREYHQLGANNIIELAFACSAGLDYLRLLQKAGLDLQTANRQIVFHLAIDADFFTNIAKLRALRELWSHLLQQCDTQNTEALLRPVIHAHTSLRMLSTLDADNNQLRNTIACAAAALGGADIISVEPHMPQQAENSTNDKNVTAVAEPFPIVSASKESRRTARNIQHVLMAESQLHRVQDPMGGSGFIEDLTSQMTTQAWQLFQSLETQGAAQPGQLDAVVKKIDVLKKMTALNKDVRMERVKHRKLPIVGVSEFATAASDAESSALQDPHQSNKTNDLYRDAEPFETLRARVARLSLSSDAHAGLSVDLNNTTKPSNNSGTNSPAAHVLLACFGTPAVYRARAGFSRNLFASAGIACDEYLVPWQADDMGSNDVVEMSKSIVEAICDKDDKATEASKLELGAVVLCGDNKAYRQFASQLASELKSAGVGRVILAGKSADAGFDSDDGSWDQEIFIGCNVHDSINALLDGLFAAGATS